MISKSIKFQMDTYNANQGNKTPCPKCKGRGDFAVVRVEGDIEYLQIRECECLNKYKQGQALKRAGLMSFADNTFDNFKIKYEWQKRIKDMAYNNCFYSDWWYIGGQSGSGKTKISTTIANQHIEQGKEVQYFIYPSEYSKLEDKRFFEALINKPILYIDDLFKGGVFNRDKIFSLINYRYATDKKTLISSELTLDQVSTIDEAIAGRIRQKCGKFIINIPKDKGKDMRV